ncbi:enoyl-CoA hydratase/isomerase family protein [Anianabacter salinae]|uniref:enoyl-CoA hydratase/isomerase family protein n=1 Tax=Anianabacter salinae TaxID=2851023 RepID=UPI00225DEEC7|nr:enoyl-CoA hydratase/isomerase family protein [Anianabacter salinae]MBV0911848.1 enoyl-CoA hydratase/isomerase family protein [Anianabacter salinae]
MPGQQHTPVSVQTDAGVMTITIQRPEARNALNAEVLTHIADAVDAANADATVRAVILTGGEDNFSAGADIDMLSGHTAASYVVSENRHAFDRIRAARVPVIAAVAGYCLGGGCEIALACDVVIASDTAVFGQPEIRLGIIPGAGGTQLWTDRAGPGAQAMAALTGAPVDAYTARRIKLVDRVVPSGCAVSAAQSLAAQLAAQAPLALRATKAAMRARWGMTLDAALGHEVAVMANLLASGDANEGITAFLEKRAPEFRGA